MSVGIGPAQVPVSEDLVNAAEPHGLLSDPSLAASERHFQRIWIAVQKRLSGRFRHLRPWGRERVEAVPLRQGLELVIPTVEWLSVEALGIEAR